VQALPACDLDALVQYLLVERVAEDVALAETEPANGQATVDDKEAMTLAQS